MKFILDVSYSQHQDAKAHGARWDRDNRYWYYVGNELPQELTRWYPESTAQTAAPAAAAETATATQTPAQATTADAVPAAEAQTPSTATDPYADYKSVSEVNARISAEMTGNTYFRRILVKGEITNYRAPNNGHYYFAIKDGANALLNCRLWRTTAQRILHFDFRSGIQVAITGNLQFYEPKGEAALIVTAISDMGAGQAALELQRLKQRLEAEGLFDPAIKKSIPPFPRKVGIVTSKKGDAIKDIEKIVSERDPYIPRFLYHVNVQGENAVRTIVEGIKKLDTLGMDVIIVSRGGGTDEELMVYNAEAIARAVYEAQTPIVSAVGHESHWTLTDLAADDRAATPTHAAEKVFPSIRDKVERIDQIRQSIRERAFYNLQSRISLLRIQRAKLEAHNPVTVLKEQKIRVERLSDDLRRRMTEILKHSNEQLIQLTLDNRRLMTEILRHHVDRLERLTDDNRRRMERILSDRNTRWQVLTAQLHGLSPTAKLVGGFGYLTSKGSPVGTVEDIKPGDELLIRIHDGTISSQITNINREEEKA